MYIHARKKQCPACGWVMDGSAPAAVHASGKATPKSVAGAVVGGVSVDDIKELKAVVARLGAQKVVEIAAVLGK